MSSMLSGERRLAAASARRGGMTVIGKIAVPKPINLPSQRSENHGLDPSVEIVPKGTLSWGSRSSSTSNAWGSSQSPRADGGNGSPSHLSGRPSSGGSGTRPSTAGSDRAHEPTASAWGPNSRPSSASGTLTSNQTSLRPRSAETRPGSSQLSRFAESLSDNPGAWGAAGTAEKLGVTALKNDEFSLTSGDFPTLGSEKDNSGKNTEAQDDGSHGRPGSSSGGVASVKERSGTSVVGDVFVNDNVKSGAVNSWRSDNPPYGEDGVRPNVEKWQVDPQPYPNPSIPPQHFEAWHGPPNAVWYRGPPGGPPYGAPVAHGGYPMDPFAYYRPQIPATALANPQPVPSQGGGPRGHRPKNSDFYRPQMPDAYIRPGMPISPGFYPGPVQPYEGYYGRPMGYCNSNERDVQFMGMPAGPSVYNRYPSQNASEPANSHGRSSGYGSGKALVSEQAESGYPHDTRGPYKVLLKQQNGWDGKDEEQKWEGAVTSATYVEKGDRPSSWENDWSSDYRNDEDMGLRRKAPGEEVSSQTSDNRGAFSSVPVKGKSPESVGNMKAFDDISARNVEHAASGLPEIPQPVSAVLKDSSLIQKIEGLNAKARASDGRHDIAPVSSWEGQKNKFHVVNAKATHSANESGSDSVHTERTNASGISNRASHEVGVSAGDKNLESVAVSGTAVSRRPTHGMQGRADNRGKGGFNTQEDGWRKKFPVADSPNVVSTAHSETNSNLHVHDFHASVESSEQSGPYPLARDEGETAPPVFDPNDYQAQRPKMKELAKQRAKQRMEEEEERIKKQKAKADAKLEELNRRTLAMEGSTQKSENASSGAGNTSRVEKSPILSSELPLEKPKSANKESVVAHIQSVPLQQDAAHVSHRDNVSQVHDVSILKQKRISYKQKQNFSLEKNSNEKVICTSTNEAPKGHTDAAGIVTVSVGGVVDGISSICESSLPVNAHPMAESSIHQRKKNSRSGKNKHKVEDTSSMAALPSSESKETNLVNASVERVKPKASEPDLDPNSVQSVAVSKDANQFSEQCSSFPNEDSHGRTNGQWKSQHSRKTSRNPQGNRLAEKIHNSDAVWAPVRPQNKMDFTEEASHKNVVEVVTLSVKSGQVQGNPKNKRAEMERYVPKPVAKEMAQQESVQQPVVSSVNQTTSDETVGRADSSSQDTESTQTAGSAIGKVSLESRNGDGRQNKQGKAQGSWRQRSSAESISVQSMQDGPSSYPSRNVQKSIEHHQPQKPDVSSVKEQLKFSDEWNASDGWNMPDNSDSGSLVTVTAVKEQGTGRAKRHPFKGHRGVGNNSDLEQKKINSGDNNKSYTHSSAPEVSQADSSLASKESRGIGERSTAHWQPKSQTFSANNQRGSRPSSGQNVDADVVRTNRKESTPQGPVPLAPGHDKKTSEGHSQPQLSQSASGKSNAEEAVNVGHQEAKRERKVGSVKGRPQSPNQVPVSPVEQAPPSSVDVRHEQRSSTGFRKSGSQNNRFGRGHESRGDWSSSGQDNKQHNPAANWERQRHNSHFEYQPVGPYNNNKSNSAEGPRDGTHNTGSRYRERGQNHSRRGGGNVYGRQGNTDRVDVGYE